MCENTKEISDKLTEVIVHLKEIKELLYKQSTFNIPPTTPTPPSVPAWSSWPYTVTSTGDTGKKQVLNS